MIEPRMRDVLADIGAKPQELWQPMLSRAFPEDPALVMQALLWLHSDREAAHSAAVPSLGQYGDERYDLQLMLDRGATSTVWQAHDRKLGRTVAIKLLDEGAVGDVLREARAASDVISDHVVRILDVHDAEPSFIVLELVAEYEPDHGDLVLGRPASEVPARDIREAVAWVARVARGVHDAHLRNVFHRDLKPRNVLITPLTRHAKIADFGLAISAASDSPGLVASPLVRSGPSGPLTVQGTPEYIAPEQARGLRAALDPYEAEDHSALVALDVWGIGSLLYALLAGRGPWGPRGAGIAAWEQASSGAQVAKLERTTTGKRVPARLRRILERCLELAPERRYPNAAAVANELDAFLAKRPTTFERSRRARAWLWTRRNRLLVAPAIAAVVLLAIALGTQVTVQRLRRGREAMKLEETSLQGTVDGLHAEVAKNRALIDRTHEELQTGRDELAALQASTDEQRRLNETVLQAKEQDLQAATAATRQLVDQLDAAKADLRASDKQRSLYEGYWRDARKQLERALADRDRLQQQSDALRGDRDRLQQEEAATAADRDALRTALHRLQQQLATSARLRVLGH